MFKKILDIWTKTSLLKEGFESSREMLERDKRMFLVSIEALLEDKPFQLDVFKEDKKVNLKRKEIKRKVFEYLALNTAPDVFAALALNDTIENFERIGDYCKDIMDLKTVYKGKVPGKYLNDFMEVKESILEMFRLTERIVYSTNSEEAEDALLLYDNLKKKCKEIKLELYSQEKFSNRETATGVSLSRFYRRIGAHLTNVCKVALQPFPAPDD